MMKTEETQTAPSPGRPGRAGWALLQGPAAGQAGRGPCDSALEASHAVNMSETYIKCMLLVEIP